MIIDFLQNFNQANRGDRDGTIWSSKNIDPQINPEKINISKVLGYRTNTDSEANLGAVASAFAFTDEFAIDRYYAIADDRFWNSASDNPNSPWTEVVGTPTNCNYDSDLIFYNGKIYLATSDNLKSYTQVGGFSDINALSANPHSMTIFANRLYVSDNNDHVESMDSSETYSASGSNTIDLSLTSGLDQVITKIEAVSGGIWIATIYTRRRGGEMIFWDGETENVASARYKTPNGVLAMCIKDDRPYILDGQGRLRVFDGTSFVEISRLPLNDASLDKFNLGDNRRFIHPNGMIVVDDEIYCLVSNIPSDNAQDPVERLPAGVWAYNENHGLYCKYTFSNTALGPSPATPTDFGVGELVKVGALFNSSGAGSSEVDLDDQSEFLAGISYYSDATTTKAAIGITNVINNVQKGGYFVTAQLSAENFDEAWKEVVAVHDKFNNSTDRIIIKYRTSEATPIYATGTWSSDTILRSTSDLSTVENGDEVEILRGTGAGACFHIDSITGTYRMQLDYNPLSGMTGTCRFRVQKWQKVAIQDDTTVQFIRRTLNEAKGSWVQFKVFMVGTGKSPQLIKLISSSSDRMKNK